MSEQRSVVSLNTGLVVKLVFVALFAVCLFGFVMTHPTSGHADELWAAGAGASALLSFILP